MLINPPRKKSFNEEVNPIPKQVLVKCKVRALKLKFLQSCCCVIREKTIINYSLHIWVWQLIIKSLQPNGLERVHIERNIKRERDRESERQRQKQEKGQPNYKSVLRPLSILLLRLREVQKYCEICHELVIVWEGGDGGGGGTTIYLNFVVKSCLL